MLLHQPPLSPIVGVQYDNPNYNFAYDVNDPHTGDIKNQHESRRGDSVLGQYSLLQPDGTRRTVDYRADDHNGFTATVNNDGRPITHVNTQINHVTPSAHGSYGNSGYSSLGWPSPIPTAAPSPLAVSRTSIVHTVSNGHPSNPWS